MYVAEETRAYDQQLKDTAIWSAGTRATRQTVLNAEVSSRIGGFSYWNSATIINKDPRAVYKAIKSIDEANKFYRSMTNYRDYKGQEFRSDGVSLPGPGTQLLKNPGFAVKMLPLYSAELLRGAVRQSEHIE